jgi:hypothetical protein
MLFPTFFRAVYSGNDNVANRNLIYLDRIRALHDLRSFPCSWIMLHRVRTKKSIPSLASTYGGQRTRCIQVGQAIRLTR